MPDFGIGEILTFLGTTAGEVGSGLGTAASAIGSGLGGISSGVAGALGPSGLGLGSGIVGDIGGAVTGGLEGSALGAATSAITGGDPLKGAEIGGATAGLLGGASSALGGSAGAAAAPAAGTGAGGTSAAATGLGGAGGSAAGGVVDLTAPSISAPGLASPGGGAITPVSGSALTTTPVTAAGLSPLPTVSADGTVSGAGAAAPTGLGDSLTSGHLGSWVGNQLGLGTQGGQLLDKFGGPLVQGGVLGAESIIQQGQLNSELAPLRGSAELQAKQSAALESAMFGGQLPPGAQAAVDQATQAATARVRSTYAGLGLSGSTMEADALNQVTRQSEAQKFQFAEQLMQGGLSAAQMSDQLYGQIMSAQMQEDKDLSGAVTNFAASLLGSNAPGSGRTVTLNLGG